MAVAGWAAKTEASDFGAGAVHSRFPRVNPETNDWHPFEAIDAFFFTNR